MPDNERLFNIDIEILCSGSSQNTGEKEASLLIEEVKHFFLPICYRESGTVKLQIENTRLQSVSNNATINLDNYNNVEVIERLSKLENAVNNLKKILEKTNLG